MDKIPSAQKYWESLETWDTATAMIKFAELHVKAALAAAAEGAKADYYLELNGDKILYVEKGTILEAYPITNIQ